jgi:dehydrogenase/reductase SDR family member 12
MSTRADRALDLAVVPGYSRLGYRVRRLRWEDAVRGGREMRGRRVLVTGGSSGIGEAVCEGFAAAGATVHMLVRDHSRALRAIGRIESRLPQSGGTVKLELCDLSELSEVREFAESFQARFEGLDLLVHNAGVLTPERAHTADGIELTFATNVLGPFVLTSLLLPSLLTAAPSRVVTISSGGMYTARLRADDPQLDREPFDGPRFYAHTKRAQVVLNGCWAERLPADRVSFHAMHPGWVDTPGLRDSLPRFRRGMRPLLRDARQGADTAVWLGTHPDLQPASGGFWQDREPRPEHRLPRTQESREDRQRLWRECEELSTVSAPATAVAAN